MTAKALVAAVRDHAHERYEEPGGWDFVIETLDDHEIEAELEREGISTADAAIAYYARLTALWDERRREVVNSERW